MEPDNTILVSGQIVAEFEDDAGQFLAGAAEFVSAPETTVASPPPVPPISELPQASRVPS